MKFQFYLVLPGNGEVFGTDSEDVAKAFAVDDMNFVLSADGKLLSDLGRFSEIQPVGEEAAATAMFEANADEFDEDGDDDGDED